MGLGPHGGIKMDGDGATPRDQNDGRGKPRDQNGDGAPPRDQNGVPCRGINGMRMSLGRRIEAGITGDAGIKNAEEIRRRPGIKAHSGIAEKAGIARSLLPKNPNLFALPWPRSPAVAALLENKAPRDERATNWRSAPAHCPCRHTNALCNAPAPRRPANDLRNAPAHYPRSARLAAAPTHRPIQLNSGRR